MRLSGSAKQAHPCFVGSSLPFLEIAGSARNHEVVPRVVAASRTWHHVIDVQLSGTRPSGAILALVAVAQHQITPREPDPEPWRSIVAQ
jgi:hypothetical protein